MTSSLWTDNNGRISRIDLGPPSSDSLRVVIERPARDLGVHVEPQLLSRLLDDAASEPGALPLLQETLFQLWGKRRERLLALADYQALSNGARTGLAFAVEQRADFVLGRLTPTQQRNARRRRDPEPHRHVDDWVRNGASGSPPDLPSGVTISRGGRGGDTDHQHHSVG